MYAHTLIMHSLCHCYVGALLTQQCLIVPVSIAHTYVLRTTENCIYIVKAVGPISISMIVIQCKNVPELAGIPRRDMIFITLHVCEYLRINSSLL